MNAFTGKISIFFNGFRQKYTVFCSETLHGPSALNRDKSMRRPCVIEVSVSSLVLQRVAEGLPRNQQQF